jgi:glycosyltransferase involved in cell wall biosynthesis
MVTGVYYPEINGATLQCRRIVALLKKDFSFTVLTSTKKLSLVKYNCIDEIPVYRIKNRNNALSIISISLNILLFFIKNNRNFNIVHLHGFSLKSVLIIFLSKLFKKKTIIKMTSYGHDDPLSISKKGMILFYFYSLADRYIGISPIFKKKYQEMNMDLYKYSYIPNGVDTDLFKPVDGVNKKELLRNSLGLPTNIKLILVVGHFSLDKRPMDVIDAWLNIKDKLSGDSGIVFIGSTNSEIFEVNKEIVRAVKDKAKKYIDNSVFFFDKVHNISEYYQSTDVYVLPSQREGLPNALLEAMSCALPSISTDLPGITDNVIEDGVDGFLYKPGDITRLSSILKEIFVSKDTMKTLGVNARSKIKTEFNISSISKKISNLYINL